jgi:hypothetical protein
MENGDTITFTFYVYYFDGSRDIQERQQTICRVTVEDGWTVYQLGYNSEYLYTYPNGDIIYQSCDDGEHVQTTPVLNLKSMLEI